MGKKLKRALGKVVCGDTFWGREKEVELFCEMLREGASILLTAQRRMGKTSLLAETERRLREELIVLFLDLQDARSGADVIALMGLGIHKYSHPLFDRIESAFGNIVKNIDKIEIGDLGITLRAGVTKSEWMSRGDKLLELLARERQKTIIMLDELPILVNRIVKTDSTITEAGRKEADELMSWIRKNSIRHQGRIQFVLSGSIGLEPVLHQVGLSATINNFHPFELSPWDDETAVGCLHALAAEYRIQYDEGVPEAICRCLGCNIPHHIQMFFGHVYDRCKMRGDMQCFLKDIRAIYRQDMLSARGQTELMHYEERLKMVLGEETAPLAFEMLTEAAVAGMLTPEAAAAFRKRYSFEERMFDEIQKEILWTLEHDGYLKLKPRGYVFVSKLLKEWWKARYSNYVPIGKRK